MSEIAFVYGNGESRMGWDINQEFEGVTTWGCNAIYRDGKVIIWLRLITICNKKYTNQNML